MFRSTLQRFNASTLQRFNALAATVEVTLSRFQPLRLPASCGRIFPIGIALFFSPLASAQTQEKAPSPLAEDAEVFFNPARLARTSTLDSVKAFDEFRKANPVTLGTEEIPHFFFSQLDEQPLVERLFWYGDRTEKGYLILDPEKVGAFIGPSVTSKVSSKSLAKSLEIKLADRWLDRLPNTRGSFPTAFLPPSGEAEFILTFPKDLSGKNVHIGLPGGGNISAKKTPIDENGQVRLTFSVNDHPGVYLVECYVGRRKSVLNFWVGKIGAHIEQLIGGYHDQIPDAYFTHFKLPVDPGAPIRMVPAKIEQQQHPKN